MAIWLLGVGREVSQQLPCCLLPEFWVCMPFRNVHTALRASGKAPSLQTRSFWKPDAISFEQWDLMVLSITGLGNGGTATWLSSEPSVPSGTDGAWSLLTFPAENVLLFVFSTVKWIFLFVGGRLELPGKQQHFEFRDGAETLQHIGWELMVWGRPEARKVRSSPPMCSPVGGDGKWGGCLSGKTAAVLQRIGVACNHLLHSMETWVTAKLDQAVTLALWLKRNRGSKHRDSCVFPVLALNGTVWSVLQLACTTGQHSLGPSTTLPPMTWASSPPGCWPCMAEGDSPSSRQGEVCLLWAPLLCLLDYLLWVKDSRQLRFTGLCCKQCVL